jgi:hypothetical protein
MKKNTATKWVVFAFTAATGLPVTGDEANITANVRIDGAGADAVDDTNPAALEDGYYFFEITAAECNGDSVVICPASTTSGVVVIGVPGAVWTEKNEAKIDIIDGIVDDILVDTAVIGALGAGLTALATQSSVDVIDGIVDDILVDTAVIGALGAGLTALATQSSVDVIDGIVDSIIVDTAEIGAAGAGLTVLASQASVDVIDGIVDSILVDTGATLDTKLDSILTDTDELQTDLTDGGRLDLLVDAILLDTGTTLDSKLTVLDGKADNILTDTGTTLDAKLTQAAADAASMRRGGYVRTLTLASGGTLYEVGDILTLVQTGGANCTIEALTVSGGVIVTFQIVTAGHGYAVAGGLATTGHTGDATFNVTVVHDDVSVALAAVDDKIDIIDTNVDALTAADPAAIADAVCDELLSGHTTAGTVGKGIADAQSAGDPWATAIPGAYGSGTAGKKLSDAITEIEAILVDTGTTLDGKLNTIDGIVDAILVDTGTTLDGKINTIDGIVDAILEDTGTTIPAQITGLSIPGAPPSAATIADAVWDEVVTAGHAVGNSAAVKLVAAAAGLATSVAGLGAIANVITVTILGVPLQGVDVWVTSDEAGVTVVAGTLVTDVNGQVTFYLDAGTYYVWQQKTGYNFTCPDELIVT